MDKKTILVGKVCGYLCGKREILRVLSGYSVVFSGVFLSVFTLMRRTLYDVLKKQVREGAASHERSFIKGDL